MKTGSDRKFQIFWFPVIAYCAIIFIVSSIERPLPVTDIPQFDKFLHLIEYGILCFLLIRAFKGSYAGLSRGKLIIMAVALTTLYGATDEFHQLFVPGRVCSVFDLIFDFLGAFIVSLIKR